MKWLVLAPKVWAYPFDTDACVAERNALAAHRLIQAMRTLAWTPKMGRAWRALGLPSAVRFVVEKHHVLCAFDGNGIKVVRVIHRRRDVVVEGRQ